MNLVRLALQDARRRCAEDVQLPLYGALMLSCGSIEHGNRDAQEKLYKAAKSHLDQAERLFLVDVALELLPEEPKGD